MVSPELDHALEDLRDRKRIASWGEVPSGWKCFGPVAVGPHETES